METLVQNTLATSVTFAGFGLHSGAPVVMTLRPAVADHGIWFMRSDVAPLNPRIEAKWYCVTPSRLCTVVANSAGVAVSTIEHIMAALAGCGVHNVLIEIDGPEVPILDGSAADFVQGILSAGIKPQFSEVRAIRIMKTVEVRDGAAIARLEPNESLEINFCIDFAEAAIGLQQKTLNMSNGAFVRELSDSRTFCRNIDVIAMRERGLALGGTLENAVVFDGDRVLSPGGLRHFDEPVRHKMLDALGDLYLAGGPILGRYTGVRSGHALTNRLLRCLFSTPGAWAYQECGTLMGRKLPGVGVHAGDLPARA
jgi:UDP-3-O-[3-hydroxymyristoyl] N-acetylglucosamine deacetylase